MNFNKVRIDSIGKMSEAALQSLNEKDGTEIGVGWTAKFAVLACRKGDDFQSL